MKTLKLLMKITMAGAFFLLTTNLFAQQTNVSTQVLTLGIPQVALIHCVDSAGSVNAISLQLTTSTAGDKITGGTGASFVQVSSIIAGGTGTERTITAQADAIPSGTTLTLTGATPASGNGGGSFGSTAGLLTLTTTTAQPVFTGIGSCYTGTAPLDGYVLNWQWNANTGGDYANIVSSSGTSCTVTFTITATN